MTVDATPRATSVMPPAARRTAQEAGQALLRLGARLYRLQVEALESLDEPLSIRQYRLLDRVDRGVRSLSEHAAMARRRASTLSKSADSLVRRGLLVRAEVPEDRRVMLLSLTDRGRRVLTLARHVLDDLALWLVDGMDERELQHTLDEAVRLYQHAERRIRSGAAQQTVPR